MPKDQHARSEDEIARILAEIDGSAWLAGHEGGAGAENLDRARRILTGEITLEEAHAELDAKYRPTVQPETD